MAKEKQEVKPRYHYFCHDCKSAYNLDNLTFSCQCGGIALTITDHDKITSGYYVNGVKK